MTITEPAANDDGDDNKPPSAAAAAVVAKPVIRGKGKALNAIAALSGRDPASIVKSVTEASFTKEAATMAVDDDGESARGGKDKTSTSSGGAGAATTATTAASRAFDRLSPRERHRFECYRRCGFASKPMEEYIARTLVAEVERRRTLRTGATISGLATATAAGSKSGGEEWGNYTNNGNAAAAAAVVITDAASDTADGSKKRKRKSTKQILNDQMKRRLIVLDRPMMGREDEDGRQQQQSQQQKRRVIPSLSNLVVANSSQEIVTIVSTLAKCYGQCLVAAAKRVANVTTTAIATTDNDNAATAGNDPTPLRPHHFIEAYEHRVRAGLDPGFWMMGSNTTTTTTIGGGRGRSACNGVTEAAALGVKNYGNNDNLYYHAALAAQNIYDEEEKSRLTTEERPRSEMTE